MKPKKILSSLLLGCALALGSLSAPAQSSLPTYTTKTASGTTTAAVWFASSPAMQCRIVGALATSDKSGAKMLIRGGLTPQVISATNTAGTAINVVQTNGFAPNDYVLIETAAGLWTNGQIASFSSTTNITFKNNVIATVPGDQIYRLDTPVGVPVGAASVNVQGEAIYVGARGRPILILLDGTSACSLDGITGRYE